MPNRISRRQFLRISAGLAAGTTLGGLLAACGSDDAESTPASSGSGGTTPATSGSGATRVASPVVISSPSASAGALPELTSVPANLKGSGEVRVASFGGALQESQRKAYFEPFERLCGIKVIEDEDPSSTKVQAMVDTNSVQLDVMLLSQTSAKQLIARGDYLEPIDYSLVDVANIAEPYRYEFALDTLAFTHVLTYRSDVFSTPLTSWKDVWDVAKFPGPRAFFSGGGAASVGPFVPALVADGVPPDKMYPLDIDRAFKSLDKIKPHVVKWADTEAQPIQLIADKEAVIAEASNGRMKIIKDQGTPVEIVWNGGQMVNNSWIVPKGAKNRENAMKFIAFTMLPISQARLVSLINYGFINSKAAEYLTEQQLKDLPTAPGNVEQLILWDSTWWVANRAAVIDRWNKWILG